MYHMMVLELHNNKLTGECVLTCSPFVLMLCDGMSSGSIPRSMAKLTKLESLKLNDNELSGDPIIHHVCHVFTIHSMVLYSIRFHTIGRVYRHQQHAEDMHRW